ncbi:MAG: hypothetical protein HHJ14_08935 [Cellulomonas sp.]|nr:hypothetical protein [Cellulomonas sp.]
MSLDGAGAYVGANWVPVLVLAIPAVVVATLLTQAFSFEAIRTLEGYWRRRGPATWLRSGAIRLQSARRRSLDKRFSKTAERLFTKVRPELLRRGIDGTVLLAVEADLAGARRPQGLSQEQHDKANDLKWWAASEPWDAATLLRLQRDLNDFPAASRVMPTRLGNVIRVTEDRLKNTGGDIEGFVMRNRHKASTRVLIQHDQFRTRLDMYCTLFFVAALLVPAAVFTLWDQAALGRFGVAAIFAAVASASYGAAISSARGYCATLLQIDAMAADNTGAATHAP